MLSSTNFWLGFAGGVLAVWGYHKYAAKKAATSA
jgi:hypothetical protein